MLTPDAVDCLQPWLVAGVISSAETYAAEVITRAVEPRQPHVVLGAALAVRAPLTSDVCVDLTTIAERVAEQLAADVDHERGGDGGGDSGSDAVPITLPWPEPSAWLTTLRASPLVRVVDAADPSPVLDERPLVLNGVLLYTQRQWVDECIVAARLRALAVPGAAAPLTPTARELLDQLLPPLDVGGTGENVQNVQHVAARTALESRLAVIVGGPGTGKTHTVARLLAVMVADAATRGERVRIGLAAPTGKAAARAREAMSGAADSLLTETDTSAPGADLAAELRAVPALTVHRLLGSRSGLRTRFRHDAANPLPYDVVVIDEMSMVAMPMMARLLEAIGEQTRVILVGDPDQLESIEVGAVLADLVAGAASSASPLHERVVRLVRPRRQLQGSPIAALAEAIRTNRPEEVLSILRGGGSSGGSSGIEFIEQQADPSSDSIATGVRSTVLPAYQSVVDAARADEPDAALHALASTRILCAHRRGPYGVEQWNRTVESWLFGTSPRNRFYAGQALLATHNDLRLRIANGDTGVVVADSAGLRAAFTTSGTPRLVFPAQLEGVETAFATTIHKSQGSEFDTVVVVLPPSSPLLRRELLYTAVTRTARRLVVVATAEAIAAAVGTPSRRVSGLAAALRE